MSLTHHLPDHLPPQASDAEQAIIGAALISKTAAEYVRDELQGSDFYFRPHAVIWEVLCALLREEVVPDSLTVAEELRRRGQLDICGGVAYINGLWESVPTAAHVEHYGKTVLECAALRSLIEASGMTIAEAHERELPLTEIQNRAETRILAANSHRTRVQVAGPREVAAAAIASTRPKSDAERYLKTGWSRFDGMTHGLPERLIIIGGRPSMGKTALALGWALRLTRREVPTLIFSTETAKEDLGRRILATVSQIPSDRLWPDIERTEAEEDRMQKSAVQIERLPLYICDEPELTVAQIRSESRRAKREHGIRCVIIDQLQTIVRPAAENENVSYTRVAYELQRFARSEGLAVVLLCQLSRLTERREKKRPMLSDLRDSGSLEQASRFIVFVHREKYYTGNEPDLTEMEVIVAKHSEGRTGALTYRFDMARQTFAELETRLDEPQTERLFG